mgnify:CR=1 FL=1
MAGAGERAEGVARGPMCSARPLLTPHPLLLALAAPSSQRSCARCLCWPSWAPWLVGETAGEIGVALACSAALSRCLVMLDAQRSEAEQACQSANGIYAPEKLLARRRHRRRTRALQIPCRCTGLLLQTCRCTGLLLQRWPNLWLYLVAAASGYAHSQSATPATDHLSRCPPGPPSLHLQVLP